MTEVIIWTPIERVLWMVGIFIAFTGGIKYYKRARNTEQESERRILFGLAIYLLLVSIGSSFFYLARYYHVGMFNGVAYIGIFDETLSPVAELLLIGHICNIGAGIAIFEVEKARGQTKHVLTMLFLFTYILDIILLWPGLDLLDYHLMTMGVIGILAIINLLIILISSPKLQNLSLCMLSGYALLMVGTGLHLPAALELNLYPIELAFILIDIGYLFYLLPVFIDIENLLKSSPRSYWSLFLTCIAFLTSMAIVFYVLTFSVSYFLGLVMSIIIIMSMIYIYKQNKRKDVVEGDSKQIDLLKIFSKPKNLTEEEVSISKEKRICLVCKNEIARECYNCPECNAFYCKKCAETLTGMENACWVCETPFDESKPVHIETKQEEEVELQSEIHKGKDIKK